MDLIERIFINVRGKKYHSDEVFIAKARVTVGDRRHGEWCGVGGS